MKLWRFIQSRYLIGRERHLRSSKLKARLISVEVNFLVNETILNTPDRKEHPKNIQAMIINLNLEKDIHVYCTRSNDENTCK